MKHIHIITASLTLLTPLLCMAQANDALRHRMEQIAMAASSIEGANVSYPTMHSDSMLTRHHGINAHGGCIIQVDSTWYWYGENRPEHGFTTEVGVEVYSSTDLTHWRDEGVALSVSEESGSPIERGCIMERPKVVYNANTGMYVMLFHLELKGRGYEAAQVGFATSNTPCGPFQFVQALRPNAGLWPQNLTDEDIEIAKSLNESDYPQGWTTEWRQAVIQGLYLKRDLNGGQMSRDQTIFIDDDTRAYQITSSEENLTLDINELTEDYLGFTGRYWRVAPCDQNEAPTILKHGGKYWLICSGCTGWAPNEARMYQADSITGPWTRMPSPMRGKGAEKTFGGQGTWILNTGTEYIFMADQWNPRHLSYSRHLWLPITFDPDGTPIIYNENNN